MLVIRQMSINLMICLNNTLSTFCLEKWGGKINFNFASQYYKLVYIDVSFNDMF